MQVTEQDNNQDPQQNNEIDVSRKSNRKRSDSKNQVQATTIVTQASPPEDQQKNLHVHPIQWATLMGLFFLILVAIVGSIIAFCVTKNLGSFLIISIILFRFRLERIIRSFFPLNDRELEIVSTPAQTCAHLNLTAQC